jgi:Ca-activated chloride channel family protein
MPILPAHAMLALLENYTLHDPWWFLALALIPIVMLIRRRRSVAVMLVPFSAAWHRPSSRFLSRWPVGLAIAGIVLVVAALARPQKVEDRREVQASGYDIVLAIDLSTSMLAEDYERNGITINRLQAIKPVIEAFIENRPNDRIGMVVFSARAYTMAPLTFDHVWLGRQLDRLRPGLIEDGTAIGDGLGVALTRLEQARHEVDGRRMGAFVVLLTDGANNRGALQPRDAARLAQSRGIPVYTIGAGKPGLVPFPVMDASNRRIGLRYLPSDIDEETLREVAEITGGSFFRALDTGTVESAFAAIDEVEKIDFESRVFLLTSELFPWLAAPGAILLLAGAALARRSHRIAQRSGQSSSANAAPAVTSRTALGT